MSQTPPISFSFKPNVFIFLSFRFYYSGRTELQAVQDSKQRSVTPKTFVRSPSKRLATIGAFGGGTVSPITTTGGSGSDSNGSVANNGKLPSSIVVANTSILTISKTSRQHDNKVTSKQTDSMPRKAWEQGSDEYDIQL